MDNNNIQELFTARIQNANLTILGYSTDYVVVQVPMKSRYAFFRLPYKSRTTYNRIINTKDGGSFVKKYFTYTVEDLASPMWTDAKTGEMHRGTSSISIPRNKIFCGLYHADLVMLDTKDEYDKYYLDRLSNDYLLKYPKTMKLYFKGFTTVKKELTAKEKEILNGLLDNCMAYDDGYPQAADMLDKFCQQHGITNDAKERMLAEHWDSIHKKGDK